MGRVILGSVRKPCPVLQNNWVSASTAESFAQPELFFEPEAKNQ